MKYLLYEQIKAGITSRGKFLASYDFLKHARRSGMKYGKPTFIMGLEGGVSTYIGQIMKTRWIPADAPNIRQKCNRLTPNQFNRVNSSGKRAVDLAKGARTGFTVVSKLPPRKTFAHVTVENTNLSKL